MKAVRTIAALLLIAFAFAAGYIYKAVKYGPSSAAEKDGRKVLYWVDPMHPAYKSDKPGIAPDCGMKLEPVYADGGAAQSSAPQSAPEMPAGAVRISPEKQQLIGVKFGKVEMRAGTRTFRTIGRVQIDESRIGRIRTKVDGWVEEVYVGYVGQLVQKNAALLTFYSPEMLAAERDLLLVSKAAGAMKDATLPGAFDQSQSLLEAARRRLELWGMTQSQINQVVRTGEPLQTLTLYSPVTGYIGDIKATPGSIVTPGVDLYTIVDSSQVAVVADVFEYEVQNIKLGDKASILLQALPGTAFTGRVQYIAPQVDASSPTYKVRLSMGNPGLALKPDMYAEIAFTVDEPPRLTVPAGAVLDAGERKVVYVDRGNGIFEPRRVRTGARDSDSVEILSGLKAGERVVASGAFLVDSESQLEAPAAPEASPELTTGMGDEGMGKKE